jgi:predicted ABC-type ATPase
VPTDKILTRYPRTLANLRQAAQLADVCYLYDALDVQDGGHALVAVCQDGRMVHQLVDTLPPWAQQVIGMA